MAGELSLLRAVQATPDDLPRLIAADWYEENGDPDRAEFIRTQVRRADAPRHTAAWFDLDARQAELFATHGDRWAGPDFPGAKYGPPERGFPANLIVARWPEFAPHYAEALDAAPVTGLHLREAEDRFAAAVAGSPESARLRRLILHGALVTGDVLEVLAASPGLAGLREFGVWAGELPPGGTRLLAGRAAFPRLRRLSLLGLDLADGDAEALLASGRWPELVSLDLYDNAITGALLDGSSRLPLLANLRELDLGHNRFDGGPPAGDTAATPCGVSRLSMAECRLPEEWLEWLAATPLFANLTALELEGNYPDPDAVVGLGRAAFWPNLTELSLDAGALPAAHALPPAPPLESLTLIDGPLTDEDFAAVLDWVTDTPLHTLCMYGGDSGPGVAGRLARSPLAGRLRRLELATGSFDDRAAAAWAAAPPGLLELDLSHNNIGPDGVAALSLGRAVEELRQLDLAGNPLDDEAARHILTSPRLAKLRRLRLTGRRLGESIRASLRRRFGAGLRLD